MPGSASRVCPRAPPPSCMTTIEPGLAWPTTLALIASVPGVDQSRGSTSQTTVVRSSERAAATVAALKAPSRRAEYAGSEAGRVLDLPLCRVDLRVAGVGGVVLGVVADLVAGGEDLLHHRGVARHLFADLEEGRVDVEAPQLVDERARVGGRAVVEADGDPLAVAVAVVANVGAVPRAAGGENLLRGALAARPLRDPDSAERQANPCDQQASHRDDATPAGA